MVLEKSLTIFSLAESLATITDVGNAPCSVRLDFLCRPLNKIFLIKLMKKEKQLKNRRKLRCTTFILLKLLNTNSKKWQLGSGSSLDPSAQADSVLCKTGRKSKCPKCFNWCGCLRSHLATNKYMLFTGREICIGKNRTWKAVRKTKGTVFFPNELICPIDNQTFH